ncbi:alpha/beta hydrolase [Mucilaginibacter sp. CSA2-8R]|uniref:alpha/beta fold hydrolase n=1 Tax=Mucilaginibacter sp. CSA2-8R TaxID=3141542 RepID=UPI00315D7ECB
MFNKTCLITNFSIVYANEISNHLFYYHNLSGKALDNLKMKTNILIVCTLALFVATSFKAQGQVVDTLINNGSYHTHFRIVKGKGVPILFESGGGDDGSVWNALLIDLHKKLKAPLITYDRAGFGKSSLDTSKTDIVSEVHMLETGLKRLGFNGRFFLVAHSLGGSYAMVFAARNPNKVAGGIFIDINTPCFMTAEKSKEIMLLYQAQLKTFKKERPGLYHLLNNYGTTNQKAAEAAKQIKMPLTIIGSDHPPYKGTDSLSWKSCLKSFAAERPNRRYVLAKNSGHYVFLHSPKLVVREIVELYHKVNRQ